MISLIVITDQKYGIGKDGKMPWHFPVDFAFFRQTTVGHPMITGRKNFQDMGALPGRNTIVLTRDQQYRVDNPLVIIESDFDIAIEKARKMQGGDEVFIVGGEQIYRMALAAGLVDKIYLTYIHDKNYDCDRFFPVEYLKDFVEVQRRVHPVDDKNSQRLDFIVYAKSEK